MTIDNESESNLVGEKDTVRLFNNLAFLCDEEIPRVQNVDEINFQIIEPIFISIFRRRNVLPTLEANGSTTDKEKFDALVDFISRDILGIPLDHIQSSDLLSSDPVSLYNLLEILAACEIYLPYNGGSNKDNLKDEAIQIPSTEFAALSISPSPLPSGQPQSSLTWSSPTNSSLSNRSLFFSSSSSLSPFNSSASSGIPTPTKVESPQPTQTFVKQTNCTSFTRKSCKSKPSSSPDSACVVFKLRDIGTNTDPIAETTSQSSGQTERSSSNCSRSQDKVIKVDKATLTDPNYFKSNAQHDVMKQCYQKFDSYEELAAHRFALEIGQKLQKALKLEEATKHIEAKLCAITGELNVNAKRKPSAVKRKAPVPIVRTRPLNNRKVTQQITSVSLKSSVYTKPLVSNDRTYKLIQNRQLQRSKPKAYSKLRIAENEKLLFDECRSQNAALNDIHSQIKSSVSYDPNTERFKKIQERAILREARTERAKVHRLVTDLERRTCSKYLTVQAKEDHLIKSQAREKLKAFRDDLIAYKDLIRSEMTKEEVKRKRLLDTFQTYYQQQLALIKAKIDQEEKDLGHRLKHQTNVYDKMRRELKSNMEKEIEKVILTK